MKNPFTRRGCLSMFLGLIIIVNFVFALYLLATLAGLFGPYTATRQALLISALLCLGNTVCAVAAWFWRKWGVIGYGMLAVASYINTVMMTGSFTNLIGLAGSSILVTLFLPFWKELK